MFKKIISLLKQILEQQKRTNQLLDKLVQKNEDVHINISSDELIKNNFESIQRNLDQLTNKTKS